MPFRILRCSICLLIVFSCYGTDPTLAQSTCNHLLVKQIHVRSADISPDGSKLAIAYVTEAPNAVPRIDVFDLASGQRTFSNIRAWIHSPGGMSSVRWADTPGANRLLVLKESWNATGSISVIDLDRKRVASTYKCAKCMVFDTSSVSQRAGVIQKIGKQIVLEIRDHFPNGNILASVEYPTIGFLDEISVSPDGNRVAFAVGTGNSEEDTHLLGFVQVIYDIASQQAYTLPLNALGSSWFSNDEIFVSGGNGLEVYIQNFVTRQRKWFANIDLGPRYDSIDGVMADPQFHRLLILVKGKTTATDLYVVDPRCDQSSISSYNFK